MKRLGSIAAVLLVFILSALALIKVYDKGKDQKPLRYADIPEETIDWFKSLGEGLGDLISDFNPEPRPLPWDNNGDYGQDPETGLTTLEDEYFIIYFSSAVKKKQAEKCLGLAHGAIPRMEEIIGKYYYPEDMNGRKVPIYLTADIQEYTEVVTRFGAADVAGRSSGVTISELSPSGYYLKAIAINGKYVFDKYLESQNYMKDVLWHELTHYCFFASVNYNYAVRLPMWSYEGIAEYTGIPDRRPTFSQEHIDQMRSECNLMATHFPYVFEVYDGGHSIFCHMEDKYKLEGLKSFLKTMYSKGIPTSMQENFSTTVQAFEADWKANLDKFKR